MTRDEAISEIQWHLGNRSDLFDQIVLALARAQRELELGHTLPWFLQNETTLALPSGSADVAFPTGFIRECEDDAFHYVGTNGLLYLEKMPISIGNRRFVDTDAGKPKAYAIKETGWKFWPERDIAYTLNYTFYVTAGTLASNVTDNSWLVNAPETLIGKAGSRVAEVIAHDRAKAMFDQMFLTAWAGVLAANIERERENKPTYLGGRL